MKRIGVVLVWLVVACNKPSDESCRNAINNMRALLGTDDTIGADIEGDVRRCKGGSTKKAVECRINAKSIDDLRACGLKLPNKAGSGSALPAPGSAAPGSAAPGSAAPGPEAPGSAAPGSAAPGSAAPGSVAPGSVPAPGSGSS